METDGCGANGVSIATGCSVGHRTMRIVDYGKVAATFVDQLTGQAVRIAPRTNIRATAARYAPHEASRWHTQLRGYQLMPTEELLTAVVVELTVSMPEIIGQAKARTRCDVCFEEIINNREVQLAEITLCRGCAGKSYYKIK